jgi:hypothetical protein
MPHTLTLSMIAALTFIWWATIVADAFISLVEMV